MLERQGFSVDKIWASYNSRAQKKWEKTVSDVFHDEETYKKWIAYSTPENRQKRYAENQQKLEELGVNATVRRRLGSDISAACGQLRREDARAGK